MIIKTFEQREQAEIIRNKAKRLLSLTEDIAVRGALADDDISIGAIELLTNGILSAVKTIQNIAKNKNHN